MPLTGALRTELRPILPSDYGWLYLSLLAPDRARRLFGGRTPRPEEMASVIWANASVVYVVAEPDEEQGHGIVTVSNDHAEAGFCTIGAMRCTAPEPGTEGIMLDGLIQLVHHVFTSAPMRKLYLSVPGWAPDRLSWLVDAGLVEHDGTLVDHLWSDGQHWPEHRYSLWREAWESWAGRWRAGDQAPAGVR